MKAVLQAQEGFSYFFLFWVPFDFPLPKWYFGKKKKQHLWKRRKNHLSLMCLWSLKDLRGLKALKSSWRLSDIRDYLGQRLTCGQWPTISWFVPKPFPLVSSNNWPPSCDHKSPDCLLSEAHTWPLFTFAPWQPFWVGNPRVEFPSSFFKLRRLKTTLRY